MTFSKSHLYDRLLFVVGAQRSGTNWLQRMLAAHRDIVGMPSETHLLSHGLPPLLNLLHHANPGSQMVTRTFVEREKFTQAARQLLDTIFLDNLTRLDPEARYLIERTPAHASHIDVIANIYPDARVVHIIRDGRAVARSLLAMEWGPRTIAEAARSWRDTVAKARTDGQRLGQRYREIRYEDVVSDPRRHVEELFGWLELTVDHDLWTQVLSEAGSAFNVDPGSPAIRSEKWREELSPRDIRTFERIAGYELEMFGYRRSTSAGERYRALRKTARELSAGRQEYLRRHLRPRTSARAMLGRALARQMARSVADQHRVIELFERMVADRRLDDALNIISARARIRVQDNARRLEGRGDEAAREILRILLEHEHMGLQPLSGEVFAAKDVLTSVITYRLMDGSAWMRALVYGVTYPQIVSLTMHRYQLAEAPIRLPTLGDGGPDRTRAGG